MNPDNTQPDTDGYYDEDNLTDEDIDLSFLDKDDSK